MATLQPTIERRQFAVAPVRPVSWGAIFSGAAIATAVLVLLGLLGVAVGAAVIEPASGSSPSARSFGIGAGIWWTISGIVSLFVGGWSAGRLAGLRRELEGPLHGLVTWAVTTTALAILIGTAIGSLASGAMHVVWVADTHVVGPGVGAESLSPSSRAMDDGPGAIRAPIEETARQAADDAAHAVAIAAWWTFVFLLLGAIAATAGGVVGAPRSRGPAPPPPTAAESLVTPGV